jgi:glucose-6-phosphate 1-epimerase
MNDVARIDALNQQFGIPGTAQVLSGNGGLPKLRVTTPAATAEIYLQGAQITSWQPAGAEEVIFVSEHAHWTAGKAIRGGIPICFPWFRAKADNPAAPAHGFVRTREWQLDSVALAPYGYVSIACSTGSDESTRRWWPHDFRLALRIIAGETLRLELTVSNTGERPFTFEEALHTYFRIGQVQSARVRGLNQLAYLDNTDGNLAKVQVGDVVLGAPTDNAYVHVHGTADLIDPVLHRVLRTNKQNSATTIVWNPWQTGALALADLGDDEWQHMLCVEAGNILRSAVWLEAGAERTMGATLSVERE